jgi:hypothetical protein
MGNVGSLAWMGSILATWIAVCALLLGFRLWHERRARESGITDADRKHFFHQDLRRLAGLLLMALLAGGIFLGSRLPHLVSDSGNAPVAAPSGGAATAPPQDIHPNRLFLVVWLSVFTSVIILLGLALIDWISTRRYAQRHRRAMNQERLEILRDTMRHASQTGNGQVDGTPLDTP